MLTIHEGFPIKKMVLYGSAAFIVGFTGTVTMLRQYLPKDESGNVSVVHPSNKQEPKTNVSNQVPKTDKNESAEAADPMAPLATSTPVAGSGTLSTRQASPLPIANSGTGTTTNGGAMSVAPATSAPAPTVSSAPQQSSGSTSTTQPAPTTQQPGGSLPTVPLIQQTVNDLGGSTGLLP